MAVSVEELVQIAKCDAYPEERVRSLAGGRDTLSLSDVLTMEGLSDEERLWVVTHSDLLEADARRQAAVEIAEGVLSVFETAVPDSDYPRKALDAARAQPSAVDVAAARGAAQASLAAGGDLGVHVRAAAEAAIAAGDADPRTALLHASSCAQEAAEHSDAEVARQLDVIRGLS